MSAIWTDSPWRGRQRVHARCRQRHRRLRRFITRKIASPKRRECPRKPTTTFPNGRTGVLRLIEQRYSAAKQFSLAIQKGQSYRVAAFCCWPFQQSDIALARQWFIGIRDSGGQGLNVCRHKHPNVSVASLARDKTVSHNIRLSSRHSDDSSLHKITHVELELRPRPWVLTRKDAEPKRR